MTELAQVMGAEWKRLSDHKKERYNDKAVKAKETYEAEMIRLGYPLGGKRTPGKKSVASKRKLS